ncbi:hypothetical protein LZ626_09735 [Aeromonas allosaccharophila]|uniref:hypothetical protein n=1 Tax=Aeromonas allosaccharophila TaxID=656 RepID=UPI001F326BDE|nr:hypothetical protein [Aeromonas allosaccharophila]MCE9848368.1 hypothetical protein [Aeromonas allosaccharophila]
MNIKPSDEVMDVLDQNMRRLLSVKDRQDLAIATQLQLTMLIGMMRTLAGDEVTTDFLEAAIADKTMRMSVQPAVTIQ